MHEIGMGHLDAADVQAMARTVRRLRDTDSSRLRHTYTGGVTEAA